MCRTRRPIDARPLRRRTVADVFDAHSAGRIPLRLEGERGEHVVYELPHFADAPGGPGPQLRRHVVDHLHAGPLRLAGDPPVEAGKVDEHDGVGPLGVNELTRPAHQLVERPQQREHGPDADHCQVRQPVQRLQSRLLHQRPAEAGEPRLRMPAAEFPHQVARAGRRSLRRPKERCASLLPRLAARSASRATLGAACDGRSTGSPSNSSQADPSHPAESCIITNQAGPKTYARTEVRSRRAIPARFARRVDIEDSSHHLRVLSALRGLTRHRRGRRERRVERHDATGVQQKVPLTGIGRF